MSQPINETDILDGGLQALSPEQLAILLTDHARSTPASRQFIFWATDDYAHLGPGYAWGDPITPRLLTGPRGRVLLPRVRKSTLRQAARARQMAEVFTPAWICNAQNNLIDQAWFGCSGVFNEEVVLADGTHSWLPTTAPITFPEGRTWRDYVCSTRLEITCGEAPYIVSRYDTTTGRFIPLPERIGLLDRKLRVVSENVHITTEWLKAAQLAYQHTYAYEWQGDSLFLAREAMLVSFIEYFQAKFGKMPLPRSINCIANIISWNVWQMDGLRGVVPGSCHDEVSRDLFGGTTLIRQPCPGCATGNIAKHNGTQCLVKDWDAKDPATGRKGKKIPFVELLK